MFGIGFGEILVVALVALIAWGPKEFQVFFYKAQKFAKSLLHYKEKLYASQSKAMEELQIEDLKKETYEKVMGAKSPPHIQKKSPQKNKIPS